MSAADWWQNKTIAMLAEYDQPDSTGTHFIPYANFQLNNSFPHTNAFFCYSVADSGLFNGRGRYNGGPLTPYAVSKVNKGKRYRFRIINASARSDFTVSVDNRTHSYSLRKENIL
jgi:hypothetical protein